MIHIVFITVKQPWPNLTFIKDTHQFQVFQVFSFNYKRQQYLEVFNSTFVYMFWQLKHKIWKHKKINIYFKKILAVPQNSWILTLTFDILI